MASHIKEDKVASVGYRLAKLLKHLDNRLCADCGVSLLEWQNYYGSLTHQVWLCNTCFETHVEVLGEQGAGGKRIKDEWTDQDLVLMEKAGSNVARNKIYERYPHFDWKKISSESPYTERIQYIKAKYLSHYFTIPPLANPTGGGKKSAHDIGYSSTLPMRTADYFVTLGPGKPKGKLSANKSITDLTFHTEILSSFPNEKFYTDHPSPIPDLLGPMVFPKGLKLSKKEERPYSYTFVLTDTYRVRQFGAVLVVHELMDPKVLQTLMTQRRQSVSTRESTVDSLEQQSLLEEDSKVLYAPKALVMLSHYPFFHLFTRFLEQIYHLSLSSSPLPIERYIANFILELPLPPQGRIAVLFSLPQCQMQISRPPRNQLPMVDFSYRPLFAMLSVDNILAIFACLCQEMSICICSKNIALLTPVQEALLSLLFPFVWQGCYVPVLPNDMVELLHAPVPLLTGMQVDDINETFLDEDPNMRPSGLVIVHLDSDTVHYGADCQPLPLSKSMLPKLRQKLVEHGSAIYQLPEELIILQNADLLYPNDEHMRPMKNFIAAQGVLSSINPGARPAPSVDRTAATSGGGLPPNPIRRISALASTGLRTTTGSYAETDDGASEISTITGSVATSRRSAWGFYSTTPPRPPKEQKYQHVASHNHPAACSLDAGSRQHSSSATGSFFANRRFALDPAYNYQPDLGQTHPLPPGAVDFNAMEIRGAFLRFFVAAFQTYEDYFSDASTRNSSSNNKDNKTDRTSKQATTSSSFTSKSVDGVKAATLTKQSLDLTSRPKSQSAAVSSNSNGHIGPVHRTFDNVKFASAQEDAFLKHMVSSQMFANFVSEIIEEPNQPEIKFFNEHIIAKRNRSKFALTKGSTPFLDDSSEDIAQSFTVPGPVTASVPQGRAFAYSGGFPLPDLKQLQVVVAERGLAGTGGAGGYLVREIGQGPEMSRLQRGESPQVMRDRVRLQFGPSMHGMILPSSASSKGSSLNTFRRTAAGFGIADSDIESDSDEQEDEVAENVFFMAARRRFEAVLRGIIRLQACIRARPARRRLQKVTQARKLLQHWWLGMKLRQAIHRRIRRRLVVRLQTAMRLLLYRRRFLRILHSIRVLQSLTRTRRLRNIFRIQRTSCQKVQAWVRGTRIRREFHKKVKSQWVLWRRQLQYLWTADCTPLKYRSSFWTLLSDSTSLVVQALYQQELRRLYDNLSIFTGANANSKTATFAEQFRTTQGTSIMLKLSALHTSTQHTAADIVTQTVAIVDESMRGQAKLFQIHENRRALAAERKLLYTLLRDDHNNTVLFRLFSLQDLKKRKQKLSDLVWVCCNDDYAAKSATAVKAIYSGNIPAATAPGKDTSTLSSSKNIVTQAAGRGLIVAGEVDWPQLQLERRIAAHCAEAAKGLVAMAEQHKKRRHTLSIT